MTGTSTKTHARHLRLANLDNWEISNDKLNKPLRKSTYVVPPDSESSDEDVDNVNGENTFIVKRSRHIRDDSDSEYDIPLSELQRIYRNTKIEDRETQKQQDNDTENKEINEVIGHKRLVDEIDPNVKGILITLNSAFDNMCKNNFTVFDNMCKTMQNLKW